MSDRHFCGVLPRIFSVSIQSLKVALEVTRNILRQNCVPGSALKLSCVFSKIKSLQLEKNAHWHSFGFSDCWVALKVIMYLAIFMINKS